MPYGRRRVGFVRRARAPVRRRRVAPRMRVPVRRFRRFRRR